MNEDALARAQAALAVYDIHIVGANLHLADDFFPGIQNENLSIQTRQRTPDNAQIIQIGNPTNAEADVTAKELIRYQLEMGLRLVRKDDLQQADGSEERRSMDASSSSDVRAEVISTFAVEYRVIDSTIIEDDHALHEFGVNNALYHVWPYWREYIQSTLARARIPQVTLPMFRLPRRSGQDASGNA